MLAPKVTQCLTNYRYVTSWIETREHTSEKSNLVILFDKYIPSSLENVRSRFKKITPIVEMAHIQMLCHLLHCLLNPTNTPLECPKEWYELYFCFACIWAFGAAMFQDQVWNCGFWSFCLDSLLAWQFRILQSPVNEDKLLTIAIHFLLNYQSNKWYIYL